MAEEPKTDEVTAAAAAAAAAAQRAEYRSTAAVALLAGTGSSSTAPATGFVRSAYMGQWLGQVENQFGLFRSDLQSALLKTDDLAASIASVREMASTCSAQCAHFENVLQQLVANHAAQIDGTRGGRDARERQTQKPQLVDEGALWKKTGSQRHWIIRGRIPHHLGESPADMQALVEEKVNVTARVAAQLRSLGDFDVAVFGPHLRMCPPRGG